ncbi:MAG: hypothetical protein HWE12_02515 [Oceanospirillaceae bacterium]|nr:hypothetical protein [Oceanospirillaceae bacterium]
MKVCIVDPYWFNATDRSSYLGARSVFLEKYADIIYFSDRNKFIKYAARFPRVVIRLISTKKIIFSSSLVNETCDVALWFNGPIYNRGFSFEEIKVPKAVALHDYNFYPDAISELLKSNRVDFLIGHGYHDKYCDFFRAYYSSFIGRVLPFYFGFNSNIYNIDASIERRRSIVGLGAIAPIAGRLFSDDLRAYGNFFNDRLFSHELRAWFRAYKLEIDCFESFFPEGGVYRDENINEKSLLQAYDFFVSDLGSLNFAPARTFQGIGSGSILIGENHRCYQDLGFDSTNSILVDDISISKIHTLISRADISELQRNSRLLAENFTFERCAEALHLSLVKALS